MIRRPPRSTQSRSSAASDVYKRQLYIEGLRDGRRFMEVALETSPKKPIVVLKAGKTDAGAKAARSHSAALAADETIFDGVLKQAGMIEADTTEEMLDIAKAFAAVPHPKGKRVGHG